MRKILFYIDSLYLGGAQRVMANLITHFSIEYEIVLVNDFMPSNRKKVYSLPNNVKRIYLRESLHGNPICKNVSRIRVLRKIIKNEKPDVILSFLGNPNRRMLLATIGLKSRKVVSVRNEPSHEYGKGRINQWIASMLFTLADGVVFQTPNAAEYFQKAVRDKSTIIMNPVGNHFFAAKRSELEKNVVTVGRFEKQKNHMLLLNAWKKIEDSFPEDKLIIYGDGPLKAKYEEFIKEQGLDKRVILPGVVTDVPEKLASAKLFVLSSDFEGMPNALMEAMAVGVPVIATDCPCGGTRMLIQESTQGQLISCRDENALQNAMKELLDSKEKRKCMGEAAKKRAKIFAEDQIYDQWEAFLMKGIKK